jgi:hypothetical protein
MRELMESELARLLATSSPQERSGDPGSRVLELDDGLALGSHHDVS